MPHGHSLAPVASNVHCRLEPGDVTGHGLVSCMKGACQVPTPAFVIRMKGRPKGGSGEEASCTDPVATHVPGGSPRVEMKSQPRTRLVRSMDRQRTQGATSVSLATRARLAVIAFALAAFGSYQARLAEQSVAAAGPDGRLSPAVSRSSGSTVTPAAVRDAPVLWLQPIVVDSLADMPTEARRRSEVPMQERSNRNAESAD